LSLCCGQPLQIIDAVGGVLIEPGRHNRVGEAFALLWRRIGNISAGFQIV
jgi:hypothetical protein